MLEKKTFDDTDRGVLFFREVPPGSNRPNHSGQVVVGKELLKELLECYKNGEKAVIELTGWRKQSKAGKPFISLSLRGPAEASKWKKDKGEYEGNRKTVVDDLNDDIPF